MDTEKIIKMKKESEEFMRKAFCSENAEILVPDRIKDFEISSVVKLETGDSRGTLYIGRLTEKK